MKNKLQPPPTIRKVQFSTEKFIIEDTFSELTNGNCIVSTDTNSIDEIDNRMASSTENTEKPNFLVGDDCDNEEQLNHNDCTEATDLFNQNMTNGYVKKPIPDDLAEKRRRLR